MPSSDTQQLELETHFGGSIAEDANYAYFEAATLWLHQPGSYAWIFHDGLRKVQVPEDDENACHYDYFPFEVVRISRFRGWYTPETQLCAVYDRDGTIKTPDEIPERLYQALRRAFNPLHWRIP